jgi:hypothetical protein
MRGKIKKRIKDESTGRDKIEVLRYGGHSGALK